MTRAVLLASLVLSMSLKTSDEIKKRLEGGLSPMPDFSRIMTVRQLADILAYLQSLQTVS